MNAKQSIAIGSRKLYRNRQGDHTLNQMFPQRHPYAIDTGHRMPWSDGGTTDFSALRSRTHRRNLVILTGRSPSHPQQGARAVGLQQFRCRG